jgi:hypothetical protein
VDIRGDRREGVDGSLRCGFGSHQGTTIAYAAQTGERITPAGCRTATRLLGLAARLRPPVLTLIDTPGAADSPADEAADIAGHFDPQTRCRRHPASGRLAAAHPSRADEPGNRRGDHPAARQRRRSGGVLSRFIEPMVASRNRSGRASADRNPAWRAVLTAPS